MAGNRLKFNTLYLYSILYLLDCLTFKMVYANISFLYKQETVLWWQWFQAEEVWARFTKIVAGSTWKGKRLVSLLCKGIAYTANWETLRWDFLSVSQVVHLQRWLRWMWTLLFFCSTAPLSRVLPRNFYPPILLSIHHHSQGLQSSEGRCCRLTTNWRRPRLPPHLPYHLHPLLRTKLWRPGSRHKVNRADRPKSYHTLQLAKPETTLAGKAKSSGSCSHVVLLEAVMTFVICQNIYYITHKKAFKVIHPVGKLKGGKPVILSYLRS